MSARAMLFLKASLATVGFLAGMGLLFWALVLWTNWWLGWNNAPLWEQLLLSPGGVICVAAGLSIVFLLFSLFLDVFSREP